MKNIAIMKNITSGSKSQFVNRKPLARRSQSKIVNPKSLFVAIFTLLMVFFAPWTSAATVTLLSENFNSRSLPTDWSYTSSNWSISNSSYANGSAYEVNLNWSPRITDNITRLITPACNLTGINSVTFSFKHYLDYYSSNYTTILGIATSSDGGNTWNTGWSNTYTTDVSATTVSQIITTTDMGKANVLFCIYFEGDSYGFDDWYFDDINITAEITTPTVTLSPTSATVLTGFTETLTASTFNVTGTPSISYSSNNTNVATVSGSGTSATVTAVAPGTCTITATMTYQGNNYTATCAITVEDPSYCEPGTGNYDNDGISNVTFGTNGVVVNNTVGGINYGDYSNLVGAVDAGTTGFEVAITYKTSYTYGTVIWVDWDQNYTFEGTEVVYAGQSGSSNPTTLTATFDVPANIPAGDYRMRIIGSDMALDSYISSLSAAANADPCGSYNYSTCHDYTLRVLSQTCPAPTGLTVSNVTDNSADLSWSGSADSYNVRYGRKYTFDDGTMQGWTTIDGGTPQGYGWQIASENGGVFGPDGSDCVMSKSYDNGLFELTGSGVVTPDNYLISPRINFGDWTSISFWVYGQDSNGWDAEYFGVAVSTTGNANASDFVMVPGSEHTTTHNWEQYTVDLSAYSGQQGYVAIRHFNCSDMFIFVVDDIAITTDMVSDVTGSPYTLSGLIPETEYVASVQSACEDNAYSSWSDPVEFTTTEPPYVAQWVSDGTVIDVSDWCTGDTRQVTLKVKNVGTATWKKSSTGGDSSTTPTNSDVVVVAYKWDEDPDYDQHPTYEFTADVAPDGVGTVTFNVEKPRQVGPNHLKFNLRRIDVCWFSEANYAVEKSVTINVPTPTLAIRNDNDLASCLDGSKEVKIVAGLPGGSFFDDFENGLGNWQTSYTNSSDYQWQQSEGTGLGSHTLAYSGQGNAAAAYDGSVSSYAYMKLNKDLSSYTDIKLSFYYKNPFYHFSYPDYYDYFYVERSTDGSNWEQVSSYNDIYHNSWTNVSNLSIPDGTKYIRFGAYIRGDYYGYGVAVDDVSITYIDPSPSSFSWSAATGSTPGTALGNTYTVTPTARHNTYTATSGGCSSSISIDVIPAGALTADGETIDCGATVSLSASGVGDATYNWYDNSSVLLQENSSTYTTGVLIGDATYKVNASIESGFNTMVYDEPGDYTLEIPDGVTSILVETWGAQGGSSHDAGIFYDNRGGKGGYSKGTYTVSSTGQTLYICVGGRGEDGAFRTSSSAPVLNADGGYNGGGKGAGDEHTDNTHETGGGGGGASHVAIAMPQLSTVEGIQLQNYSNNRNDVLVVAGGGGGSSCQAPGGCGGGSTGGDAYWAGGEPHDPWQQDNTGGGRGGSESTNGTFTYVNKNGNSFTSPVTKSSGGFGKGADGADNEMANPTIYPNGVAGGGGGYYGGCVYASAENGRRNSGGGGSGYTNTGLLSSFETIDGEHEMPNPNGGTMIGKTGNGFVKITLFGTQTCTSPMVAVPVSVNPANVTLTQLDPQSMCAGTSITLPAHPGASSTNSPEPEYDYSWNAASGLVGSSEGIQISKSGTYTYNVTATLNSNDACTATDSKTVEVSYKTPLASEISAMGLETGNLMWTGLSTDWNASNNWMQYSGGTYTLASTPTSLSNVVIGSYSDCVSTPTLNVNADASVNTLRIASGITVSGENTLSMDGNLVNNGTFNAPVRFNGNTTLSGSGTTRFRDITIAGTFNASSASLAVFGDWTNNGTFTANGPVVFAGTSAQTIGGSNATAFNNVTFNNANGISISKEPTINGTATFTSGIVTGDVTFGSSAKVSGASTSSHVDGIVKKNGAAKSTDFYFPTGSNGNLGKVVVTDGTATNVSVQYFSNPAGFSVNDLPRWWASASVSGFDHVSNVEYWKISSTDTITANFIAEASTDMHFNSGTAEEDKIPTNIQMAFYDNNHWTNVGGSASIGNNMLTITGAVIPASTTRGISGNYTTFGSKTASTVLPIELTSFTATCDGRSALVEWSTATERNNDYFSLERSDDAINFTEIARVAGAGNSIEPIDYSYTDYGIHGGDNYYRLVQVDYDGTRTVSEIVVANCIEPEVDGEPEVLSYPNPFNGELTLVLDNFSNRAAIIEVYDMLGKLIYTEKASAPQNSYETILNLSNLPSGAYMVRVSTTDFVINKNVVKN